MTRARSRRRVRVRARSSPIGCRRSRIWRTPIERRRRRWPINRLADNLGSPVGANLADAAALVDAIVQRVESHVSGSESRSAGEVALATQADGDLSVAERLAERLGSNVNRAAQLRGDLVARRDLAGVADRAAAFARRARTDRRRTSSTLRRLAIARRSPRPRSARPRRRFANWRCDAARRSCRHRRWRSRRSRLSASSNRSVSSRRCRGQQRAP